MSKGNGLALMSRIREKANRLITDELAERGIEGIVPSHGDILGLLFREGSCPMNDIAEKIHRTRPTVTVLVDKLSDLGYVRRRKSSDDSRVTFIELTDEGRSLKPALDAISKKLNRAVYGSLSEDESLSLEAMLSRILDTLEKH